MGLLERMSRVYGKWEIYYCPNGPVTGKWMAYWQGVTISSNTEELLINMIELRGNVSELPH